MQGGPKFRWVGWWVVKTSVGGLGKCWGTQAMVWHFPREHWGATEGCRKLTKAGKGPLDLQEEPRAGCPDLPCGLRQMLAMNTHQWSPWASLKPPMRPRPQDAQGFRLGNVKLGALGDDVVPVPY